MTKGKGNPAVIETSGRCPAADSVTADAAPSGTRGNLILFLTQLSEQEGYVAATEVHFSLCTEFSVQQRPRAKEKQSFAVYDPHTALDEQRARAPRVHAKPGEKSTSSKTS